MQCLSCVFDNEECTHRNAEEEWQELAESGECPGYYGRDEAHYDAKLRFAEKG